MTDTKHWCVSMSCFLPLQYTVQSMRRVSSCSYQSAEKFVKGTSLLGKIVPEWNRATVWSSSFFFKGSFHLCVIIVSWEGDFIFFSTASFACLILVWSSFVQICFHSYLLDVKRKSVFFFLHWQQNRNASLIKLLSCCEEGSVKSLNQHIFANTWGQIARA